MNTYAPRAQLKAAARDQLTGRYLTMASVFFTMFLLRYIFSVPSTISAIPGIAGIIAYYAIDFVLTLLFAVYQAGISYIFLSNACGIRVGSSNIFMGFSMGFTKVISIWVIPALLLLIPVVIPDLLMSWIMEKTGQDLIRWLIIWMLLVLPLSWLIQTIIKIPFAMVYYLLVDFPEMEAAECRRTSIKLMHGNKWRYFKMLMSFLPLYALGILSFGIGLLYVLPYREQTIANFYLDLVQKADSVRE